MRQPTLTLLSPPLPGVKNERHKAVLPKSRPAGSTLFIRVFTTLLFFYCMTTVKAGNIPNGIASPKTPMTLFADTVITGQVNNEQGEPLMGVTVSINGSKVGYITDALGRFSIKVPANASLVFTYVGYLSQTVAIRNQKSIDVVLQQNKQSNLEDVVVTALGVSKV
ncbi:MAG: hypothetical protein RL732_258, partial [Bacteroidota bacterium]